ADAAGRRGRRGALAGTTQEPGTIRRPAARYPGAAQERADAPRRLRSVAAKHAGTEPDVLGSAAALDRATGDGVGRSGAGAVEPRRQYQRRERRPARLRPRRLEHSANDEVVADTDGGHLRSARRLPDVERASGAALLGVTDDVPVKVFSLNFP